MFSYFKKMYFMIPICFKNPVLFVDVSFIRNVQKALAVLKFSISHNNSV